MINDTFYPTPVDVIDRMLKPLVNEVRFQGIHERGLPYKQILEPSAGKGDILDRVHKHYHAPKNTLFCIEQDPELQLVLTGKGYRLIDNDFLGYCDQYLFDLIVMNPPFRDGVKHLLKAWEVLHAGDVVCLLNAETLLNPYTEERKLLQRIVEAHGCYEVIGEVFKDAERPTDVNCAIVWLHKEVKSGGVEFDADGVEFDAPAQEAAFSANPLAHPSIIKSLVAQYQRASELLVQKHKLEAQYRFYTQTVKPVGDYEIKQAPLTLNEQLSDLKKMFWRYIFDKTNLGQRTTSNFRQKFDQFAEQTARMAFSEANIMQVLEMFFLNRDQIMQDCILEVFDKATAFHEKNAIHTEGWKTNKSWRIAPKIILPWGIRYEKWGWSKIWTGNARDFYGDIDKVLCFLSGQRLEDVLTIEEAIRRQVDTLNRSSVRHDLPFSSTFFEIRIFKKGTVHLVFKDKDMLAKFNQAAAQGKKWVGAGY